MTIAQLAGLKSLRDIRDTLRSQGKRIYHLGLRKTSRATLARVNEQQPHELYKAMFYRMLDKCSRVAPKHRFKFNGKGLLLDTTTVDLCLSVFPWAKFRRAKGAIKLHFGLDADGYLPAFMDLTDGKFHEINWAKKLLRIKMKKVSLILSIFFLFSGYVYAEKRSADGRYLDLGNGVIKDTKTGMMWTQKDSYVDLGHSLSWNESIDYVNELSSGGYRDWRLPTISELKTIYEPSKSNKDIYGGRVKLDPIFAERGTYSYWSSDTQDSCCALAITFDYGYVSKHDRDFSGSYGVRAVRQ